MEWWNLKENMRNVEGECDVIIGDMTGDRIGLINRVEWCFTENGFG